MIKKYKIFTYGCAMNKSDSERLKTVLEKIGYRASKTNEADLVVINMCSVRQSAVDRIHGWSAKLEQFKKSNRNIKTVLTGCILPQDKKKLKSKFDIILDINDITKLPNLLGLKTKKTEAGSGSLKYLSIKPTPPSKFSAYVPIMTGCNRFCTYCVVPYVRGAELHRPASQIISEIKKLLNNGCKEITLLGQTVNAYHDKNINFSKLLKLINAIPGKFWIRFTSPHPKYFTNELINTISECDKVCEYLHLPVQSGDDRILKKMNRNYTVKQYKNIILKIRKKINNISISTDIIVGFPTETKKQFLATAKLMRWAKFDMAYIAQYSARKGTAADSFEDNVPKDEKKQRAKILTKILEKTAYQNNKKYVNKKIEVLITGQDKKNNLYSKTRTFKNVKIKIPKNYISQDLRGQFLQCQIIKANVWGLEGRLIF